jgi:hypothetical protein
MDSWQKTSAPQTPGLFNDVVLAEQAIIHQEKIIFP